MRPGYRLLFQPALHGLCPVNPELEVRFCCRPVSVQVSGRRAAPAHCQLLCLLWVAGVGLGVRAEHQRAEQKVRQRDSFKKDFSVVGAAGP